MKKITPRETPCYCSLLRRAANNITKMYDKVLAGTGLTVCQFSLLNDLRFLGVGSKVELAAFAKLDRTTITRNIKVLRDRGYVDDISSRESRNSQLQITQAGIKLLDDSYEDWEQAQKRIKNKVGKEKLALLKETLQDIAGM